MMVPGAALPKLESEVRAFDRFPRERDIETGRFGPQGDGVRIPVGRAHFTLVDECDAEDVLRYPWHVKLLCRRNPYIYRYFWDGGQQKTVYLHRYILKPPFDLKIDHANSDGMDNTRRNLRLADSSQNATNARKIGSSGLHGIHRDKRDGRWVAEVCFREVRWRRRFDDVSSAVRARDEMALAIQGPFAVLNRPVEVA